MAKARPTLVLYCQHSLGIGHLTRSFALAQALSQCFRVVFLNGGRLPPGLHLPPAIELINLPALGMDDGHTVVSRGAAHDVAAAQAERRALLVNVVDLLQPALLLVELFPFGRKKFAGEILPMIRAARRQRQPARVVCSLRDILVHSRPDQQHHDDRARWLADRYFDAVLVHADPAFARLDQSFRPRRPLRTAVHYTGYVVPRRAQAEAPRRGAHLLVSAGGGIVGDMLFHAALRARERLRDPPPLRIVAGPFLPETLWAALQSAVAGNPGVQLLRQVPDMVAQMRTARASISQCGYNSALDIVVAGVPGLVVPYEAPGENEQCERASRLAALGALRWLPPSQLTDLRLAAEIEALLAFRPRAAALDLNGAAHSTALLEQLLQPAGARRCATA